MRKENTILDYFENTTKITKAGYTAILYIKHRRQRIICRIIATLFAAPFLGRLIYAMISFFVSKSHAFSIHLFDTLFFLSILLAWYFWKIPQKTIQNQFRLTQNQIELQAVNQYVFSPEGIQVMSTSTLEKFWLNYQNLTWIRTHKRWIILYFSEQNFTMLIDKQGFTYGEVDAFILFLKNKQERNK